MPDGGDTIALYDVGEAWEGAGAMTVGKYVPLALTTLLARPVLESPP